MRDPPGLGYVSVRARRDIRQPVSNGESIPTAVPLRVGHKSARCLLGQQSDPRIPRWSVFREAGLSEEPSS